MAEDRLSAPVQESVLTLLAYDERFGAIAAGLLAPGHFDIAYRDIADRLLDYRRRYGKPPGDAHIGDVFDDVLDDPKHRDYRSWSTIVNGMMDLANGLNAEFTFNRLNEFIRKQTLRSALLNAGMRIQQGGPEASDDVERMLNDALRVQPDSMDLGTFLNDKNRVFEFLDRPNTAYSIGIPPLDRLNIGPTRGELLVFIAVKGGGKSWFVVHVGKHCLLQSAKVLHISLEMPEPQVAQRYMQSLFAVAKRKEEFDRTAFTLDELDRLTGFEFRTQMPKLWLADPNIRTKLGKRMDQWGDRFGRLVIKKFPTNALTVQKLESYLDMLELSTRFVPDVVLLDYPDLMKIQGGADNLRLGLGLLYKELRGLADTRKFALVAPSQASRQAMNSRLVTGQLVAEDFSKLQTADMVLTYSQTAQEHELNLARIFVDKARSDEDKFTVLLSQLYKTGQFAVDSMRLANSRYWDMVRAEAPDVNGDNEDD